MPIFIIRNEKPGKKTPPPITAIMARPEETGAILIAINKYQAPGLDLRGCINDSRLMESVFVDQFGIPPANLKILRNELATRKNILNAARAWAKKFRWLVPHYSGHRARVPSSTEADYFQGAFVPHDYRPDGTNLVYDWEFKDALQEAEKCWLIIDGCFAGEMATRADGVLVRSIAVPPQPLTRHNGNFRACFVELLGGNETEPVIEKPIEGRQYGVFSWWLAKLWRENPGAPLSVLKQMLAEKIHEQHPEFYGADGQFLQIA